MSKYSRRSFLVGSAAATGAATFGGLFGYNRVFGQSDGDDPQTILNLAVTAETFACTHYYNALQNADALELSNEEIADLRSFLDAELAHKLFLEDNGAETLATEFFVPENLFTDRSLFLDTTITAEDWFIAAYLAATRRFAELGNPLLAATASQVSGVEAEHQALLRRMDNRVGSNRALKQALFFNTSEVVPLFQPFLEGADGFVGPAPFPGVAEIQAEVGDQGVIVGTPFIALDGTGTMDMDDRGMAMADDGTGPCTVSATNVNVRQGPSTDTEIVGALTEGNPREVIGQTVGASGFTWLQIDMGWVRGDVVNISGDCSAVPMMEMDMMEDMDSDG